MVKAARIAFIFIVIVGCNDHHGLDSARVAHDDAKARTLPLQWVGRWTGPEGTYLLIEPAGAAFKITIKDLDTERQFDGVPEKNGIAFTRNGVKEFIHATTGLETQMKWLSVKKDCLTVRPGEGYCRD